MRLVCIMDVRRKYAEVILLRYGSLSAMLIDQVLSFLTNFGKHIFIANNISVLWQIARTTQRPVRVCVSVQRRGVSAGQLLILRAYPSFCTGTFHGSRLFRGSCSAFYLF